MELDDLKQSWNKQSEQELKNLNNNIMEMIHNKSYGPLTVIKDKIMGELITFSISIGLIIYIFLKEPDLWYLTNFLFFCLFVLAGFYWRNYRLINRMQKIDATVKETLEKNVKELENNFKKRLIVSRGYFIITVVVIEVLMRINNNNLETWHSHSIFIRIAIYIALFIFIYFTGKYSYQKKFGKHITYLKELLEKIK